VLLGAGLLMLVTAPAAQAETDMTGRWVSDSLRDNRVGYHFELKRSPDGYIGVLRFTHRDGRRQSAMPMTASMNGDTAVFRAVSGAFDRSPGLLRGVVSGDGSVLTFTNCQARLRLVMANDLDSDCVFRRTSGSVGKP